MIYSERRGESELATQTDDTERVRLATCVLVYKVRQNQLYPAGAHSIK